MRSPTPQLVKDKVFAAWIGGINSLSAGSSVPETDAAVLRNFLPTEGGLRSRYGQREWVTGLTGLTDNLVRTVVPFAGSQTSKNKLFACTSTGIWDVSASTATPSQVVTFPTQTGEAGYGVCTVLTTLAGGHYLFYTDEENGLYVYTETSGTWARATAGVAQLWAYSTNYAAGNQVVNGSNVYVCTVGGLSAASGTGPTGTGTGITDGTVTWNYVSAASSGVIGASLVSQQAGLTADPTKFVFCMTWANRVWFAEKNTGRSWYLPLNSIAGAATAFNFGMKFRAGGSLVGLWSWTADSSLTGLNDSLVVISSGGDIVIYQGTDPDIVGSFAIKGVYFAGTPVAGRRIATNFGGDMLVCTKTGVVQLNSLLSTDALTQYATKKISPLFNSAAVSASSFHGWSVRLHPEDASLIITYPTIDGTATSQFVTSLVSQGWSQYDLPIYSSDSWQGLFYFGTTDGRIIINTGYVDGVTLANPNSFTPISCQVIGSFQSLGSARQKRVMSLRPRFQSDSGAPTFYAAARFNYDTSDLPALTNNATGTNTWDNATWDSSKWAGISSTAKLIGTSGSGVMVAVAVKIAATSRVVLQSVEMHYQEGGLL